MEGEGGGGEGRECRQALRCKARCCDERPMAILVMKGKKIDQFWLFSGSCLKKGASFSVEEACRVYLTQPDRLAQWCKQIALGTDYAGMWSSDETLAKELTDVRGITCVMQMLNYRRVFAQ